MTESFRVLPILVQMCSTVDRLFVESVGPFGQMLVEEAREKWLASGNKLRSSDIEGYISLLAQEIDTPNGQADFTNKAREIAGVSHLHSH